jgi:proteasome beta subunit
VGADYLGGQFTASCLKVGTSSFADFLAASAPELLPGAGAAGPGAQPAAGPGAGGQPGPDLPHGTTIVAADFGAGVIMAGDRRSTAGNVIAQRDIEKVFRSDDFSCVGIAGVAGIGLELVRLFQLELEHYEKITGDRLSLEGKANRLAQMIRGNLPLAMQGLVVVPLFGGFDERRAQGRLFRYDVTGGRWEEEDYHANGSGGRPAKSTLKKRWKPGLSRDDALRVSVESLLDASQEDVATGGPDPARGIFPLIYVITAGGVDRVSDDDVRAAYEAVVAERA